MDGWPWWAWLALLLVGSAIPTGAVVSMLAGRREERAPREDPGGRVRDVG